ncbi:MAG TPA: hypothetical protein VFR80_10300 [Pyrinomonadaceae bacterium]|nr:hypothetical protein [Pyrinomonadaceae bacterium]
MPELFANVEINREPRWQLMSKLAGASLLLHAAALASLIYVPAVRDMFNIAALLSDTGYVDKAYTRTEIGEDVQMLQMPPAKFRYPDGYFATETELQLAQALQASAAAPPVNVDLRPISLPTPTPTPEPSPTVEPSPSASPAATPTTTTAEAEPETPKTPEETEAELNKIAAEKNVVRPSENEINTRPLKDWLARADAMRNKGELDLTSAVEITIAAKLGPDCKLVDANVVQKTGDVRLIDVAKEMVAAIGDSGMLSFLRDPKKVKDQKVMTCDSMPLTLTIKLDQTDITAMVETEADSPQRASEMASGYNGMLVLGQIAAAAKSKDEEVLYRNTKVTSDEKKILVNFSMPRQTASEMLKKQLTKAG